MTLNDIGPGMRDFIGVGGVRITESEHEVATRNGTQTPTPHTNTVREVIDSRDAEYGGAWLLTGEVAAFIGGHRLARIIDAKLLYTWLTILCKLIRLLTVPYHRDSWVDIAGYAQLVIDNIDKYEANERGG